MTRLLDRFRTRLTAHQVDLIEEFIDNYEYAIAVEWLLSALHANQSLASLEEVDVLDRWVVEMEVSPETAEERAALRSRSG